jgi:hypothetical protein
MADQVSQARTEIKQQLDTISKRSAAVRRFSPLACAHGRLNRAALRDVQ